MGYTTSGWGVPLLLLAVVGCGDGDDGKTASEGPPSDRSADCQRFQSAACARGERCGLPAASECLPALRMTYCKSDEAARACTDSLEASSCSQTVACGEDVIDYQPAIDVCNQFLDVACEWVMRCDATVTRDQCLAEFQSTIDCSRAVGVALTQKQCFDALEVAGCEDPKLPTACSGMIQVK